MRNPNDKEDDSAPGGRALDRLRQFEIEREYEDAGTLPSIPDGQEGKVTIDSEKAQADCGQSKPDAATIPADG